MSNSFKQQFTLPPEQQAIRDKCFHPSGTFVEFPMDDVETSIPARFEKIVRTYPNRIAVKDRERLVTYSELNRVANRVAHRLANEHESNSTPVALLFENSIPLFASILGVLKAGKVFVLLDPSFPPVRNATVLEDSQAKLLLTDKLHSAYAAELSDTTLRRIYFESIESQGPDGNLLIPLSSGLLTYIAYTSCSTGEPKGVMNTHRNVLYDVMLRTNSYHISNLDRLSLVAAFSVHAINNMLLAFLNGAMLLPFNVKKDGLVRLAGWMVRERITISRFTIQLFREFCDILTGTEDFTDLRLIQFAGDSRFISDVKLWRKHFPSSCLLANGLSSSETGYLTDFLIDHTTDFDDGVMPAGYAVKGKELLLLDDDGKILDENHIGELAVKSRFLSPGYWQRPDLSSTTFKAVFNDGENQIFFTGNIVLRLPDGSLVYKGRKDFRIKIRGHNVEPADIENALRQHKNVRQAGVVFLEDEQGTILVAYVVPEQPAPSVEELRRFLTDKLAEYMIPARFVFIETLPLTNGKLDRKALPLPGRDRPVLAQRYVAAQSESEQKLVEIWQEVLRTQPIGIHDNFVDLGGNSLVAMRILSSVKDAFAVDVSMTNLLDAPTVAALADQIERQRATSDQPQTAKATPPRSVTPPGARDGVLPLSYAEEGLWLIDQIQPGITAWNMQSRFRLRGVLNTDVLTQSLNALVQRHEILRTAYQLADGNPVRVITPFLSVDIPVTQMELSPDIDAMIERVTIEDRSQAFDLANAPLFRARLARINEQDHVLIFTDHHIITDAWSSNIFARELFALYNSFSKNAPSPLTNLPIQYSDYALWERQSAQGHMADQLSYWRNKLAECEVSELPTDKRQPLERSYRGAKERVQLSREHSSALWQLCKQQRATRFMVLMAAFKLLFGRYTGSSDIVVGSALHGRNRPELDTLIGMFVNILPLRTDLSGQPTFRELINRVRETCVEAYQNQDMPFDKLVAELNPNRELSRNPFFQVLFNVVSWPSIRNTVDGLNIDLIARSDDTARFDLTFSIHEIEGCTEIVAAYNSETFSEKHIFEMSRQYKHLVEQIVEDPDQPIDQYSLVTPSAKQLLPDPTLPLDDTWHGAVHELVTRQAHRQPNKVALEDPFGVWSYKELNDLSNQVANYLLAQGIKRADVVAVYGQRSAALVCALLGVLKAGAAFCVIDPSHPVGRLAEYLAATNPKAVIELFGANNPNAELEEVLNRVPSRCRITLRRPADALASPQFLHSSMENPNITLGPDDLAYIIFTSGSTGKPKGVMGRHGPLTHFLPWLTETFGLSELDRFSFLSSIATNKLQREIFTALAIGATLYIPSDDTIGSFGKLDDWLREKEISTIHLSPAMAQLLDDTARASIPSVQRVFFGGDLLQIRDVKRAKALMPNAVIVNFYNSSETQRGGAYLVFSDQELEHYKDIPPLGHGVKDVQLLILRPDGQRAGVSELGEICVRSPHLARGYLGDEALTSERFITNSYTEVESDRIYKTGELGRYLPDGSVEFVARAENQVSIRGFRVELGEIESALKNHPSIANAVVTLHSNSTDRLIAHLVAKRGVDRSIDALRAFLKANLPNCMIPAAFVFCDSLPLTPTGKVDRLALAAVDLKTIVQESSFEAPRTPLEETLAQIWRIVLNLSKVGIHNNFFDLGGHSLLAVQVMSRLRDVFGIDLPLLVLFEAPTIAEMAQVIESLRNDTSATTDMTELLNEIEKLSESEAQQQLAPDDE